MRTGKASRHQRLLQLFERNTLSAVAAGLYRLRIEDEELRGDTIRIDGRRVVNFGYCAYLGLNLDPRIKQGAIRAVERFGPSYSSSAGYSSVNLYTELEDRLSRIVGSQVVIPATTTLGHLGCLPVLIGDTDAVLIDAMAHSSVHLATQVLMAEGIPVMALPHNDLQALETAVAAASERHAAVWYLADGVYSMFGDVAPVQAIAKLLDRYESLHLYFDDAHGFGWQGLHGRGVVLDAMEPHPRMVLAASLSKSFGGGGAVLAFADSDKARRVQLTGSTLTFSGPLHPPELGASVAAADIHLSDEHAERRSRLLAQIDLMRSLLLEHELPIVSTDRTPIWYLRPGGQRQATEMARALLRDGFFVNLAIFPAVPLGYSGLRFTQTLYHSDDQIEALVDALARHLPSVVEEEEILIDLTEAAQTTQEARLPRP